jgi:NADH-quinone oxidoreductase subunit L
VNAGFDEGCKDVTRGGRLLARLQTGRVQGYLRGIGGALVVLALWLLWGAKA